MRGDLPAQVPPPPERRRHDQLRQLFVMRPSTRQWHFPLLAALCTGIPVLTGAWLGQIQQGVLASVGALIVLNMPQHAASLWQRLLTLAVCLAGFLACATLGLGASFTPWTAALALAVVAFAATAICRVHRVPPPGNFFFILVASLTCTLPFEPALLPQRLGLLALGGLGTCTLAMLYTLTLGRLPALTTAPAAVDRRLREITLEATVTGLLVGGSYLVAILAGLDKPYWVPISCAAIMQGPTFTAVWQRKVHRLAGTTLGLVPTWLILSLPLNGLAIGAAIILLNFVIEYLIVRNYGLACIFITPLTVLLAESAPVGQMPSQIVVARLVDIAIGSSFGLLGGWLLHQPQLREWIQHGRPGKRRSG